MPEVCLEQLAVKKACGEARARGIQDTVWRGPPGDPRREAQASEHRHQADVASLELAGHGLGGAQRHQAGLLDGPAPATEVQGETG